MENQGNFREQSTRNMQRAVVSGKLTVKDYYERQAGLSVAETIGIDDGSSRTKSEELATIPQFPTPCWNYRYSSEIREIFLWIQLFLLLCRCNKQDIRTELKILERCAIVRVHGRGPLWMYLRR